MKMSDDSANIVTSTYEPPSVRYRGDVRTLTRANSYPDCTDVPNNTSLSPGDTLDDITSGCPG